MRSSIVTTFLVALVTLAVPPRAFAQDAAAAPATAPDVAAPAPVSPAPPAPAVAPVPPGDWSIGAGVTYGNTYLSSVYVGSSFLPTLDISPGATASLERRLSRFTWLVLGVNGYYVRERGDEPPAGYSAYTTTDLAWAGASVGLRHQVTGAGAPVAVSFLALAEGSWTDQDVRATFAGDSQHQTATGWAAGASLGLAVERELTSRLALRASTPLVYASYSETRTELDGAGEVNATGVRAGVTVAPRLELRLSF
jgi:hypothetical protein